MSDRDFLDLTDRLLARLAVDAAAEEGLAKVALASLVCWREVRVYAGFEGRGDPDPARIAAADDAFITHLQEMDDRTLTGFRIGIGAAETPLEEAIRRADNTEFVRQMRHGLDEGSQRASPFGRQLPRPDPADMQAPLADITSVADRMAHALLEALAGGMQRKPFLRILNALILIEEAAMVIRAGLKADAASRRKAAVEFALTRYLGGLPDQDDLSLDEITTIMRETGRAARLSRVISDGLDRVQDYARKASADADMEEAGRAAERPLPKSVRDLAIAARQCRKFRDRERA